MCSEYQASRGCKTPPPIFKNTKGVLSMEMHTIVPALNRQRQCDQKLEASLGYIRPHLQKAKRKQRKLEKMAASISKTEVEMAVK